LSALDLRGKKALVMGLGLNGGGVESARFLARRGATVTATDLRDESALAPSIQALEGLPIRFVLGRHEMEDFERADIVVKNPAVKADSPYLARARRIETDISLFLMECEAPILAVTGSKGKSSTSSAIHHGLVAAGFASRLGGNIAISPLSFVDELGEDPVVLELSSWQLGDLKGRGLLKPKVALITSIMPDHLNHYPSMEAYVADKRLIYSGQGPEDFTLHWIDDDWGRSFGRESPGTPLALSNGPLPEGMRGAWLEGLEGFCDLGGGRERILGPDMLLIGSHQRRNLLCAALALRAFGVEAEEILPAMASFPGIEHRMESCAERGGARWYNDSAATIPEACAAAIVSFESPLILITGGTDKALDFSPLAPLLQKPKEIVLLAGSGTDKLLPLLASAGRTYRGPFDSMAKAVAEARRLAEPGDVVVLSPGCASFGMFKNEFDRGRQFRELVRALP
jgi:UDP-N-acetylmuramoylalanine--D-glutamate ligase